MIRPLVRRTLHEEIVEQILKSIEKGYMNPGDRIDGEAELAKQFQVSRNIVREALKSLELIGVVQTINGKGTFISDGAMSGLELMRLIRMIKNDNYTIDLMESRILLEGDIAYLAAQRATAKDLEELAEIGEKTRACIENNSYKFEIGLEFHMNVAQCSKNHILQRLLRSISDELIAQRGQLLMTHKQEEELIMELKEHLQMLRFIRERKPVEARRVMQIHLSRAMRILRDHLE